MTRKLKKNCERLRPGDGQRIAQGGSWRDGLTSSSARGYGYRWQCERADFLRRNPLCVMCRKRGDVTAADTVDHVTPHRGDMTLFWDQSNWQPLCAHCHNVHKAASERANA